MQIKVQPLIKQLFKCGVCIFVEQRSATPKSKVKCQLQRASAFEISKDDPFLISWEQLEDYFVCKNRCSQYMQFIILSFLSSVCSKGIYKCLLNTDFCSQTM